jgi:hypothetical protein
MSNSRFRQSRGLLAGLLAFAAFASAGVALAAHQSTAAVGTAAAAQTVPADSDFDGDRGGNVAVRGDGGEGRGGR